MVFFEPHNNEPCDDSVSSTFTVVREFPDKTTTTVVGNNNDMIPRRPTRPQEEDDDLPRKEEHRISSSCFRSSTDNKHVKPPRNVHFSEQAEMRLIPTCLEMEDHEIDAVWFSGKDHVDMKNQAKALALESRRSGGRHAIRMLDQCYPMAKRALSESTEDKDDDTLFSRHKHPYQVDQWTRSAMGARGLEHWISKDHCMTRFQRKNEVRQTVLEKCQSGETVDQIAQAAQQQSASSRLLALWAGHADAQFRIGPHVKTLLEEEILQDYYLEQEQKKRLHQELFGTNEFGGDTDKNVKEEEEAAQSEYDDLSLSSNSNKDQGEENEEEEELAERQINPQSVGCTVTYHRRPKPRAFLRNMFSSHK